VPIPAEEWQVIEKLESPQFKKNDQLRRQLRSVLEPSYHDCSAILERVLSRCDTLYLFREGDGEIEACFLVGAGNVLIQGKDVPTVFLGLIASTDRARKTGAARLLYTSFSSDAAAWERANRARLLLWCTTATPSSFNALHLLFAETQPSRSGEFDEWGEEMFELYERQRAGPKHPSIHSA
jgi:hypothetical protein